MKQIKYASAVLAAVLMLLTSCLGDTGNSGELYSVPGRVRYSSGKMLIDTYSAWGTVYTTQLSPLEYYDGDWMYLSFSYDMESPENANREANGYTYVTLLQSPTMIPKGQVHSSSDTTQVMPEEIALINGTYNFSDSRSTAFLEKDLMFTSEYSGLTDQKTSFFLYYDYNKESYASSDNLNTYTLYLRAIKTAEGKTPATTFYMPNYYNLGSVLNAIESKEKNAGNTSYYIEFRYVSEIDEETGELTWKTSIDKVILPILEE